MIITSSAYHPESLTPGLQFGFDLDFESIWGWSTVDLELIRNRFQIGVFGIDSGSIQDWFGVDS